MPGWGRDGRKSHIAISFFFLWVHSPQASIHSRPCLKSWAHSNLTRHPLSPPQHTTPRKNPASTPIKRPHLTPTRHHIPLHHTSSLPHTTSHPSTHQPTTHHPYTTLHPTPPHINPDRPHLTLTQYITCVCNLVCVLCMDDCVCVCVCLCLCVCVFMFVCVCVCVWEWKGASVERCPCGGG